jgi:hypothetical protein
MDYFQRAKKHSYGRQSPVLLGEALSWRQLIESGAMLG